MAKIKSFNGKHNAISFSLSDRWYEIVDGDRRYEYFSLTSRKANGKYLIVSLIVLFFKISIFIEVK